MYFILLILLSINTIFCNYINCPEGYFGKSCNYDYNKEFLDCKVGLDCFKCLKNILELIMDGFCNICDNDKQNQCYYLNLSISICSKDIMKNKNKIDFFRHLYQNNCHDKKYISYVKAPKENNNVKEFDIKVFLISNILLLIILYIIYKNFYEHKIELIRV